MKLKIIPVRQFPSFRDPASLKQLSTCSFCPALQSIIYAGSIPVFQGKPDGASGKRDRISLAKASVGWANDTGGDGWLEVGVGQAIQQVADAKRNGPMVRQTAIDKDVPQNMGGRVAEDRVELWIGIAACAGQAGLEPRLQHSNGKGFRHVHRKAPFPRGDVRNTYASGTLLAECSGITRGQCEVFVSGQWLPACLQVDAAEQGIPVAKAV